MSKKSSISPVLALFLALCLCSQNASALEPVSLALRWFHQFQFAGYYAALEKGFYREAGLDVRINEGGAGADPVEAVLTGRSEFGIGTSSLVVNYLKGEPVLLLGPIFQHSPNVLLVRGNNKRLVDLVSPEPVPIAVMAADQDIELKSMFINEGISPDRLQLVKDHKQLDDLKNNRVAALNAYLSNEPYLLEQMGMPYTVLKPSTYGLDFYGDVLFTRQELEKAKPQVVAAFYAASKRGWEYALAHPEEIADLISQRYNTQGKSREHLLYEAQVLHGLINPEVIEIGHNNPARWRHIADVYARFGLVDNKKSLERFFYAPHGSADLDWLYGLLVSLAGVTLVIGCIAFYIVRINRRLRRSMVEEARARQVAELAHDQLAESARELKLHNSVLHQLNSGLPLGDILDALARHIESVHPGKLCSILLLDKTGEHLRHGAAPSLPDFYNQAIDGLRIGPGVGSCGTAAATGERVIVEDISTHPYWRSFCGLAARAGLGSCWSQPFKDSKGRVLGTFAIYQHTPSRPGEADIAQIERYSSLVELAVERSYIAAALQESEAKYRLFIETAIEGVVSMDSEWRLTFVNRQFATLLGYGIEDMLGQPFASFMPEDQAAGLQALKLALAQGQDVVHERSFSRKDGGRQWTLVSAKAMHDEQGRFMGSFAMITDINERKALETRLQQQATTDELTGIINRRYFLELADREIRRAHRLKRPLALAIIDLDHFKLINDTHGHAVGDEALRVVTRIFRSHIRDIDLFARLGGDEFVLLLPEVALNQARLILERINQALSAQPANLCGRIVSMTLSVGVADLSQTSDTLDTLLERADQALYRSKEAGRNRVSVH